MGGCVVGEMADMEDFKMVESIIKWMVSCRYEEKDSLSLSLSLFLSQSLSLSLSVSLSHTHTPGISRAEASPNQMKKVVNRVSNDAMFPGRLGRQVDEKRTRKQDDIQGNITTSCNSCTFLVRAS